MSDRRKKRTCDDRKSLYSDFYVKNRNYLSHLINDCRKALSLHHAEEVLIRTARGYALNMNRIAFIASASVEQDAMQ